MPHHHFPKIHFSNDDVILSNYHHHSFRSLPTLLMARRSCHNTFQFQENSARGKEILSLLSWGRYQKEKRNLAREEQALSTLLEDMKAHQEKVEGVAQELR